MLHTFYLDLLSGSILPTSERSVKDNSGSILPTSERSVKDNSGSILPSSERSGKDNSVCCFTAFDSQPSELV